MRLRADAGSADLAGPALWVAAERACARPLADLAAALARLDERLSTGPDPAAEWARLALEEAAALARGAGLRAPLEALVLWRHGAPAGRVARRDLLAAAAAARRLAAPPGMTAAALADAAGLRRFLGLSGLRTDPVLVPLLERPSGPDWMRAAEGFLADLAALAGLHPLTRGAAALALWRGHGPGGGSWRLDGAVLAARVAAEGQGGARFLPLGDLPGPRAGIAAAGAEAWLTAFLAAGLARVQGILADIRRRRDWAARAAAAAPPGRVVRAAVALLAAEPVVSANLLRDRAGVSQQAANAALVALARAGLAEEISGQRRYRIWRAAPGGAAAPRRPRRGGAWQGE